MLAPVRALGHLVEAIWAFWMKSETSLLALVRALGHLVDASWAFWMKSETSLETVLVLVAPISDLTQIPICSKAICTACMGGI